MDLTQITVSEFLKSNPAAAAVLEKCRIDYCCGGGRSLSEACAQAGVEETVLVRALRDSAVKQPAAGSVERWKGLSLQELVSRIVEHYHDKLMAEIPRLRSMAAKVAAVHGAHRPEFHELAGVFNEFANLAEGHLDQEERVLFPRILAGTDRRMQEPIDAVRGEHERQIRYLDEMRDLCDGYVAPGYACNTWRALYSALESLDREMRDHIDAENLLVFPRALACA